MKYIPAIPVLLITLLSSGTLPAAQNQAAGNTARDTATPSTTPDYKLQPGDVLEISVWKEKDLQRDVIIRPDGGLSFPLVGDVQTDGKTIEQLRKEITQRLAKYIPDPAVTVATKQPQGNAIFVIGRVNKPGSYVSFRNLDVMQALSIAGGVTPFAAENSIKILRRVNGIVTAIPFKYGQVAKGKRLEQNIILQSGDIVVVP
jgi:polysaccharide export outer membrane protein